MFRRLVQRDKRREALEQVALQKRLESGFVLSMARQLSRSMRQAVKQYESDGSALSVESVILSNNPMLEATLKNEWTKIMRVFGGRILGNLKASPSFERKDDGDVDYFELATINYLRKYGATKVKNISQTTVRQIRSMVEDGEREGLPVTEIAKAITGKISSIARIRAEVIARTEVHQAANVGAFVAAESTGLNLMKEWVSAADERTREGHADADGQMVALHDKFQVADADGNMEELEFPGDPAGSASNVIMCRCAVSYVEV